MPAFRAYGVEVGRGVHLVCSPLHHAAPGAFATGLPALRAHTGHRVQFRCGALSRRCGSLPCDEHSYGSDTFPPSSAPARRCLRGVRPLQFGTADPRRSALSDPHQTEDARLARADHLGVLRLQRRVGIPGRTPGMDRKARNHGKVAAGQFRPRGRRRRRRSTATMSSLRQNGRTVSDSCPISLAPIPVNCSAARYGRSSRTSIS